MAVLSSCSRWSRALLSSVMPVAGGNTRTVPSDLGDPAEAWLCPAAGRQCFLRHFACGPMATNSILLPWPVWLSG